MTNERVPYTHNSCKTGVVNTISYKQSAVQGSYSFGSRCNYHQLQREWDRLLPYPFYPLYKLSHRSLSFKLNNLTVQRNLSKTFRPAITDLYWEANCSQVIATITFSNPLPIMLNTMRTTCPATLTPTSQSVTLHYSNQHLHCFTLCTSCLPIDRMMSSTHPAQ